MDGRPRRPILPFRQLWIQFGLSARRVALRSLKARAWESLWDSWWMACGTADLISKPAWRYTIGGTFNFGSFWVTKKTPFWDPNFTPHVVSWRSHISMFMGNQDLISSIALRCRS